jgi:endoglucanase
MTLFHTPRRAGLGLGLAALAAPAAAVSPLSLDRAQWAVFQARYITPDGRVVDTGNGGISHSEGQGWAMLFAVRMDDRAGFDRVLGWTRRHLRRAGDQLHAWKLNPAQGRAPDDQNNATDGDLCIAWALLEAGDRWGDAAYTQLGTAITRDILRLLVVRVGKYAVLLPGVRGFDRPDQTILNPSYYVFPAFAVLARAVPDPAWVRLAADGLVLLRAARFGRWGLPPDWALLHRADGTMTMPRRWPTRFSYDAVRVPLYLAWAQLGSEPALLRARGFWADPTHGFLPAWADLSNDALSPYPGSAGVQAVAQLAGSMRTTPGSPPRPLPWVAEAEDYYAAALVMLARLARREISPDAA